MASFEFLAIIFTGIGLIVSILYYTITLQNANKTRELALKAQEQALDTRQAQLFMPIYNRFNSPETVRRGTELMKWEWSSPEDFWNKYGSENNPEDYIKWNLHAGFLEGVGVLVKRDLIDIELVDDLMSISTLLFWNKFGEVIVDGRTRYNLPQLWEYTEYLYYRISEIAEEQHPKITDLELGNKQD